MDIADGDWSESGRLLVDDRVDAFCTFARYLNFNRAAEELHISQPALHKKVSALQNSLGRKLYVTHGRTNRVVALTSEGERLRLYAEDVRRLAADTMANVGGAPLSPLTVAASRGVYLYVILEALRLVTKRRGGLRIITADDATAIDVVRTGVADLGVIAFGHPPGDLQSSVLVSSSHTLVVRRDHRLASNASVDLADLAGVQLALPERGERIREYIGDALATAGVEMNVVAEALNWELLVHFVTFGVEATIVSDFVPIPVDLVRVPVNGLRAATYYAAWRTERSSQAAEFLHAFDET